MRATQMIKQVQLKAEREVLKMIRDAKRRKSLYNPGNTTKEHQKAIVSLMNKERIDYLPGVDYIETDPEDRT